MTEIRKILSNFENSKILQVYFARIDEIIPEIIPFEFMELYNLELDSLRTYLLNQYPIDPLVHRLLSVLN